jgi:hypothetical protein
MGNKVTCTCGHSWNKSDSSKKDATVCHICGKDNEMENGGWLDKYEQDGKLSKAQDGKKINCGEGFVNIDGKCIDKKSDYYNSLYNQGRVGTMKDDVWYGSKAELPEVTVSATKAKPTVDQAMQRAKFFTEDWMNSPMYMKMLSESDPDTEYIPATTPFTKPIFNSYFNENRLNQLNAIQYINRNPTKEEAGTAGFAESYKKWYPPMAGQPGMIWSHESTYPEITFLNNEEDTGDDLYRTAAHEISHVTDISGIMMPDADKAMIDNFKSKDYKLSPSYERDISKYGDKANDKKWVNQKNNWLEYVNDPTETRARLSDFRMSAKEQKLYDPFTQKFELKYLKNYKPTKNIGFDPIENLRSSYSDEEIEIMLNSISKANKNSGSNKTAYGGMVLKQKTNDNYGKRENANEGYSAAGPGWIGEGTTNKGFNYNGAWGGQFAMGGTIPGAVGFTYARTKGIPSEGPYAKKTLPSAQNGEEMKYYQEGLDWQPKMISKNGGDIINAQDGRTMRAANAEFSCEAFPRGKDKSATVTNGSATGFSNAPITWNELVKYNETNPKDKVFKSRLKDLQSQFPGLTSEQLLAAQGDSARIKQRMSNLPRYDKPAEQTYDKAYHQFYRTMMDQLTPVTTPQILQFHSQKPGGLPGYQQTVQSNYGRPKAENGGWLDAYDVPKAQNGVIQDDRGQLAYPGEITQINSPYITMRGVPYPVLGIADTGEEQMMYPGQDYEFEGAEYVTEYPKGKRPKKAKNGVNQADENSLVQLDQLTNFTNYNKPTMGGWLDKYN